MNSSLKCSDMACDSNGITQFSLPATYKPYLPLLPSCRPSPLVGWYSLRLSKERWPGWVDLKVFQHWQLNPGPVTHPSTNRARRRVTSLTETNVLPLCQMQEEMEANQQWFVSMWVWLSTMPLHYLNSDFWNHCQLSPSTAFICLQAWHPPLQNLLSFTLPFSSSHKTWYGISCLCLSSTQDILSFSFTPHVHIINLMTQHYFT